MGMDVFGKKPTSKRGEYFRNNVWWWRPLAGFIEEVAPPELFHKCRYWQSNDGDGLGKRDSLKLAEILTAELDSRRAIQYEINYTMAQEETPDETCDLCQGTGYRTDLDKPEPWTCNGCNGKGTRRPSHTWYPFSAENVRNFRDFLLDCGGFAIC